MNFVQCTSNAHEFKNRVLYSSKLPLLNESESESALSWFTSYLTNRTYQVTWNGSLSKPCMLETGVPQGSVLGPILFSLYTSSLGSGIASHSFSYHCYADDTKLFLSFPSSDKTLIIIKIMKIFTLQHPQNPALPHKGSSSASSPFTGHLPSRLLQLTHGWTSCLCD